MSVSPYRQTLSRTSPRALTLTTLDRPLLEGEWEVLFRSPDLPLRVGDAVSQEGGLRITVQAVAQGHPTRVLFELPRPLEESDFRLLLWGEGRFDALTLPVGRSVTFGRGGR
jgi:hypothetical protein